MQSPVYLLDDDLESVNELIEVIQNCGKKGIPEIVFGETQAEGVAGGIKVTGTHFMFHSPSFTLKLLCTPENRTRTIEALAIAKIGILMVLSAPIHLPDKPAARGKTKERRSVGR